MRDVVTMQRHLSLAGRTPRLILEAMLMRWYFNSSKPEPRFSIKMWSYQYRKSHCGHKTVIRLSYPDMGYPILLTHWGWDKMDAIFQTRFSNGFSWMKMHEFWSKFHWNLFLGIHSTILQHWFRYWLGADQAISHYLNQWWLGYWHIYALLGLNELNFLLRFVVFLHITCLFWIILECIKWVYIKCIM